MEIALQLPTEPGDGTVESIKRKVQMASGVKSDTFYMRAVTPTPGVAPVRVKNTDALANVVGYDAGELPTYSKRCRSSRTTEPNRFGAKHRALRCAADVAP